MTFFSLRYLSPSRYSFSTSLSSRPSSVYYQHHHFFSSCAAFLLPRCLPGGVAQDASYSIECTAVGGGEGRGGIGIPLKAERSARRGYTTSSATPTASGNQGGETKDRASLSSSPYTDSSLTVSSTPRSVDGSHSCSSQPRTLSSSPSSRKHHMGGTPGKHHRFPDPTSASQQKSRTGSFESSKKLRIRPRAPWGLQQLRDSWSEDAMTSRGTENMSERTHRAYRYHPDEFRRFHIKYAAYLTIPCIILGMSGGYYFHTGKPIWKGDPQEILNYLRRLDTSPRSALYAFSEIYDHTAIPEHIARYREEKEGEKELREAMFQVTHTVFRKPTAVEWKEIYALLEEKKAMMVEEA